MWDFLVFVVTVGGASLVGALWTSERMYKKEAADAPRLEAERLAKEAADKAERRAEIEKWQDEHGFKHFEDPTFY